MDSLATPPEGGGSSNARWPRAHTRMLVVFLGVFLLLLVVFREVLFPFLMAIYLAYLVEPVIGWATKGKFLGKRWGRAPVLVSLYLLVIGVMFLMVSCGVQKLADNVSRAATDLKRELDKSAPAAKLELSEPAPKDIRIPAGTVLETLSGERWKTLFPAQINEGVSDARVL